MIVWSGCSPSYIQDLWQVTRLWEPGGSEVDLALPMDVECPGNPFVSAFPPWLIALSLGFFRRELICSSESANGRRWVDFVDAIRPAVSICPQSAHTFGTSPPFRSRKTSLTLLPPSATSQHNQLVTCFSLDGAETDLCVHAHRCGALLSGL